MLVLALATAPLRPTTRALRPRALVGGNAADIFGVLTDELRKSTDPGALAYRLDGLLAGRNRWLGFP